jgi:hypothetical protein
MLTIPFREQSFFREQIQLTGILYFLTFNWNALNEFWSMEIADSNEVTLIAGIKIVPDYPLLAAYSVNGQPAGEIICQNVVNAPDEIGRFGMSQKFELVYYEPNELETLINAAIAEDSNSEV